MAHLTFDVSDDQSGGFDVSFFSFDVAFFTPRKPDSAADCNPARKPPFRGVVDVEKMILTWNVKILKFYGPPSQARNLLRGSAEWIPCRIAIRRGINSADYLV